MEYNLLRPAWEPQIIGVKNGIAQVLVDKNKFIVKEDYSRMADFFSGINWEQKPTTPPFEIHVHATLLPKAKLTDFLQFNPYFFACPFMISQQASEVLKKFNLQKHHLYPVTLYDSDKIINQDYKLLYMPLLGYEVINFSKTVFYTAIGISYKQFYTFNSLEEFKEFSKSSKLLLKLSQMTMNENFDRTLDLFMGRIGEIHVSARLRKAIQENKLTGVNIFDDKEPFVTAI